MKTQRFGIEIEMTGVTRREAANVIAEYFGSLAEYRGGAYDEYQVLDSKERTWKLVSDGSLTTMKKIHGRLVTADKEYSVELVSPILTYGDIEPLQELVRLLRKAGAISSSRYNAGIHIHVDAKPHTPNSRKNLVNLMASKEELLYKSLVIDCVRMRYCKKVNEDLITAINKKKPKTLAAGRYLV